MTENEKFIFKTLQWFMALGVTVMLFLQGYMITFMFETYTWKGNHEIHHQINEIYYNRRIYIDSTNCNTINKRLVVLEEMILKNPKMFGILPKKQEYEEVNSDPNLISQ